MIRQDAKTLLEVRGLHATVNGIEILKGIDLTVRLGEIHAIMGPNGSGKSTLAKVLAGHPAYVVTAGEVRYDGNNLLVQSVLGSQKLTDSALTGRGNDTLSSIQRVQLVDPGVLGGYTFDVSGWTAPAALAAWNVK